MQCRCKRYAFILQKHAFYMLKGHVLRCKTIEFVAKNSCFLPSN